MKQWTESEYRAYVEAHCKIDHTTNEALMSLDFLRELAYDARVPDRRAKTLQMMLESFEAGELDDLYASLDQNNPRI